MRVLTTSNGFVTVTAVHAASAPMRKDSAVEMGTLGALLCGGGVGVGAGFDVGGAGSLPDPDPDDDDMVV